MNYQTNKQLTEPCKKFSILNKQSASFINFHLCELCLLFESNLFAFKVEQWCQSMNHDQWTNSTSPFNYSSSVHWHVFM